MRQRLTGLRAATFRLAALLIVAASWPLTPIHPANAQDVGEPSLDEVPRATRTHAITDARIVQAPGDVLEDATVVIRDGIITAVGTDVDVPTDARIIEGDTLTVYAGFLLGPSHAGLPAPGRRANGNGGDEPAGDPSFERAGITPQQTSAEQLRADDASLDSLRQLGFTTALSFPYGRMLPGTGALIRLAGEAPEELVIRPEVGLMAQFRRAAGVYPSTPMGILAKWRQLYRESERRLEVQEAFADGPAGRRRPAYDPVHAAFFPVIRGERPVYFHTEGPLEIHRALELQETLGFPLALTGLSGATYALEALEEADHPLFLTLDLPTDTTAADTTEDVDEAIDEDLLEARRELLERQQEVREQHFAAAASLQEAGLTFGFTSLGANLSEVRANLRLMTTHGLSEEDALAALTTDAADLLDLNATHGTIEEGKLANLVVTDGPYFDEETSVRFVFVEGRAFAYEANDADKAKQAADDER